MNIYTNLDDFRGVNNPVLTIGTYDGVHLGHQKIIDFLNLKAKSINGESVVFTFHPHPRMVLHPNDHNLELIQTIDERINKLEKAGVNHLIVFPFTKEFSRLSAVEFIRDILVNKVGIHTLIVGYDHHFGRNREGSMAQIEELAPLYNFEVEEIPAFMKGEVKISSTKIRSSIKSGEINIANKYLGEPFTLEGIVVKGQQVGHSIGFPTANLEINENYKIIPSNGVYAVNVIIDNTVLPSMLNIGKRPTVSESEKITIEVHIFDFNKDIYNKKIGIEFVKMIRKEKTFTNLETLKNQLSKDENNCRTILIDFANANKNSI